MNISFIGKKCGGNVTFLKSIDRVSRNFCKTENAFTESLKRPIQTVDLQSI